jgi:hypothetical protein
MSHQPQYQNITSLKKQQQIAQKQLASGSIA